MKRQDTTDVQDILTLACLLALCVFIVTFGLSLIWYSTLTWSLMLGSAGVVVIGAGTVLLMEWRLAVRSRRALPLIQ